MVLAVALFLHAVQPTLWVSRVWWEAAAAVGAGLADSALARPQM